MILTRFIIIIACLVGSTAFAQSSLVYLQPGFEVGIQSSRYQYKEPGVMDLTGNQYGITGSYTYVGDILNDHNVRYNGELAERAFVRIDLSERSGKLNYNSKSAGGMSNVPNQVVEGRVTSGITFPLSDNFSLTPYVGLGYRSLYNDLRGQTSTGAVGYRRDSSYTYIPTGFTMRWRASDKWVLVNTVESDNVTSAKQKSRLSDTGINEYQDITVTQNVNAGGWRLASYVERGQWSVGLWTQCWKFGDSAIGTTSTGLQVIEPRNSTRETGLEVRFHF